MSECHLWDLLEAPPAPIAIARAKLKAGWRLYVLDVAFGGWGSVSTYAHALMGPDGELMLATEKTVAKLGNLVKVDAIPQVKTRTDVLILQVPLESEDVGAIEAAGARWVSKVRRWCVRPQDEAKFRSWMPEKRLCVSV